MNIGTASRPFAEVVTELLGRGYEVRFRAKGGSMWPAVRGGEMITVGPVREIGIGDVAFYQTERGLIAHRVVGIRRRDGEAAFLMRGESRGSTEEEVQEHQVFGKVVSVERNGQSIDPGGRLAKMRSCAISFARLAHRLAAKAGGYHCAGMFLLVSASVAVFPNAARASIAVTNAASTVAITRGPTSCTLSNFDASTGSPNLILIALTFDNVSQVTSVTSSSGTVSVVQSLFGVNNIAELAIFQVTGFSNATLTFTANFNGTNGFVCGAVAFSGVSSVGNPWTPLTGTSTSPSVTGSDPGAGGVVFDLLALASNVTATPGSLQIQQWQVTGSGPGAASVATPTGSMSWSLSGSSTWAEAAVPLIPLTTTEVQVSSFTVTPHGDRNIIELKTGREVSSLGFNLYRDENGRRTRLNSSLLAGTALLAKRGTTLTGGYIHTWWDAPPGDSGSVSYSVEEIDLRGRHTWFGPATANSAALTTTEARDVGHVRQLSQVGQEVAPPGASSTWHALQAHAKPITNASQIMSQQFALAGGPAVKVAVQAEGWYHVALSDLVAAGLDPNADPATLHLYAEGVEQPIVVQAQSGNRLHRQGSIQFYGTGLDTTWSDTRIYWLTWGKGSGRRAPAEPPRSGAAGGPSGFPFTVEWKPRTVYFAALLNGDADNFFGPSLTSAQPVSQAVTIVNLDQNTAEGAQLRVALQGVSVGPHSVAVALNGSPAGTVTFSDQTEGVATLPIPAAVLREGPNQLTLTVDGGDGDVSVVDSIDLSYPHTYMADNDTLRFTSPGGQAETIGGFSNAQIFVVDISNPEAVTLVPGTISQKDGSYRITIVPQGSGIRTLLAFTSAQQARPASIVAHHPSSWNAPQTGFDMVMISHASFMSSLAPLVTLRQGQGLKVAVIDVEELYDEFNFGEKSPYAVKGFLSAAKTQWQLNPRFVLLMGDATFDPRDYLGKGNYDFVPTYLVDTALLETASDDWFADFSGQAIPQMAVGRLPARTPQEAAAMVTRIVNNDQSGGAAWKNQVLLVADQNDSSDNFAGDAAAVKALLPGTVTVSEISQSSSANGELLNSLNVQGAAMVDYMGHGSEAVWAGGLFSSTDAAGLTNGSMVPFVVSMTCLNGYFQDVYGTALAKALMDAPGGGALAVWASSGLTDSGSQAAMNQALVKALFGTPRATLGEAAITAKTAASDLDVRRTWILFGDPATKLQ
jgi:hypothetical protein